MMDNIIKHFSNMSDIDLFYSIKHHEFNYYQGAAFDLVRPYFKLQLDNAEYKLTIQLKAIIPDLYRFDKDHFELIMHCEGIACDCKSINPKSNPDIFKLLKRIKEIQRTQLELNGINPKIIDYLI